MAGAVVMTCMSVQTGRQFLSTMLASIDCQGRTIGAYGYAALSDPASVTGMAVAAVLTLFVALFGIRLMLGYLSGPSGLVDSVVRVGLFLALATSWPAWRVLAYDLVLDGPAQLAGAIGRSAGLPGASANLSARLQLADDGIVALTALGSGRLAGGVLAVPDMDSEAAGIALADQFAMGWARATFLATAIGATALSRIGAGLLLALAPLMAGLLLFTETRAIFIGWLRGLGFCALGSLAFTITAGAELAVLFPWLNNVLADRQNDVLTPSAPTELMVMTMGFALATGGIMLLTARVLFLSAGDAPRRAGSSASEVGRLAVPENVPLSSVAGSAPSAPSRAGLVAAALEASMRREAGSSGGRRAPVEALARREIAESNTVGSATGDRPLGDSWRRTNGRPSIAGQRRDQA